MVLNAATFLLLSYAFLITSLHAGVSPHTSRLVIENSRQSANGQACVTVVAEIRDENGNPISGEAVALRSDNSSFIFIQPASSDMNGSATGYIKSNEASSGEVWALAGGGKIYPNMVQNPSVESGSSFPYGWSRYTNLPLSENEQKFLWEENGSGESGRAFGMHLSSRSEEIFELSWFQDIGSQDLEAGRTYMVSALVRRDSDYCNSGEPSGLYLSVTHKDSFDVPLTSSRIAAGEGRMRSDGWEEIILSTVVFPAGAADVELSLDYIRNRGSAYFDNVRMTLSPNVNFKTDISSPGTITASSPTLLSAMPGENNGEIIVSWIAVGNDGFFWPNPMGSYEIRISDNFSSLPVSSWTFVNAPFTPASPGTKENLVVRGLIPGATYQLAVRAADQSGNRPEFGFSHPVPSASALHPISIFKLDPVLRSAVSFGGKPSFSGETEANAEVHVGVDGAYEGRSFSDSIGRWKYEVQTILAEGSHWASFQAFDVDGNASSPAEILFQVSPPTESDELKNPFPNPARVSRGEECSFFFTLTQRANVKMRIFDLYGDEVMNLLDCAYDAGTHSVRWNGRKKNGDFAATGSYYALFETERQTQAKKFSVLR